MVFIHTNLNESRISTKLLHWMVVRPFYKTDVLVVYSINMNNDQKEAIKTPLILEIKAKNWVNFHTSLALK